ncbi:MAG: CPBP family intramembrane metalloprotease [Chloroflexi bacterium]|nr:MAG: CPBP family intramembrane metalloprotease [Chloroflexota bacterium]
MNGIRMKTFTARYPALFVGLSGLALILAQYIWLFLVPGLSDETRMIAAKATECLLAIFLLGMLSWRQEAGFVSWRWRDFIPALPLLIIPLLMVVSQFDKFRISNPVQILSFAALAAMTGFAEETVFRGIALHALLPKGALRAALLSPLIFSLLHFVNLLQSADPLATFVQVIFAFLFGVAFAGPLLYSGSIWPLVTIHAIQDFIAFWTTGSLTNTSAPTASEALVTVVLMLPFAVYGLWLIRRPRQTPLTHVV